MSTKADLEKLTVVQLKELCTEKSLPATGVKAVIIDRLIKRAEEDALLNDGADISVAGSIEECIDVGDLNEEEILAFADSSKEEDDTSSKDATTTEDVAPTMEATATTEADTNKPKTVVATSPSEDDLAIKIKRAQRFGLPVDVAGDVAKANRVKRFGISPGSTNEEAKARRAERFELQKVKENEDAKSKGNERLNSNGSGDNATKEKLLARAARFGLAVNTEGKQVAGGADAEKLAARAKRFHVDTSSVSKALAGATVSELDEKKLARAQRFGT